MPRILNVDDFDDGRFVKSEILRMAGFQVLEAATGKEALKQVAEQKPDLVLLDVKLPDINGFEVCRRIKKLRGFAPMVLHISMAYNLVENQTEGLESGADAYLVGPVEPELLVANIKALLRMQKAEQEVRDAGREWQTTFDAINDGVALVDASGIVVRHNATFMDFVKESLPDGSYVGGHIDRALGTDSVDASSFPHVTASRTLKREGLELQSGDRWIRVIADPIFNEEGALYRLVVTFRDITARKSDEIERARLLLNEQHAKQKAEENERLFRTMAETMHQLVITTDASGATEYCNRRWIQQTGIAQDRLLGQNWLSVAHPDELTQLANAWKHSLETGETFEHELRIQGIDKEKRWYICRALPELDDWGRCLSWVITFTDIHETKTRTRNNLMLASAAELLALSLDYRTNLEKVLRSLVPEFANQVAVQVLSPEGTVELAASAHPDLVVAPAAIQKVLSTSLAMILEGGVVTGASSVNMTAILLPLLARGKTIGVLSLGHLTTRERQSDKLEALRQFAERLAIVIDNSNLYFQAKRELTERKRIERELRESEQKLKTVTESMPQIVWSCDVDGRWTYVNHQWEAITGSQLPVENPSGWIAYLHEDDQDRVLRARVASLRTHATFEMEFRLFRASDSTYRWHLARAVPVFDITGKVDRWIGTFTDIDDKRRAEEQTNFLSDASQMLMNCLDVQSVIHRVRDFILPKYADWLSIDLLGDDGTSHRVLSAHHDLAKQELLKRIYDECPSPKNALYGYRRVLKTGRSQLLSPLTNSIIEAASVNPLNKEILVGSGMKSLMCVPLITRGRTIGCLTVAVTEKRRLFDHQDLILIESLAQRIAITLDNVQLLADLQTSLSHQA